MPATDGDRDHARPAFATVGEWCRVSGMSRSGTYQALGRQELRARKLGARTLVDVAHGLAWLGSLPPACIGAGKRST